MRLFRAQLDEVVIAADLERMAAADQRHMVCEFEAPFDAIHCRVRFAPEIGEPGDIDADIGATGELRKAEVQPAPRDLRAEFVERLVADNGVMLEGDIQVPRLVVPGT